MAQAKMRIKKNLPKGVGMQIIISEGGCNLYPDKQRFVIEFLINRELSTNDTWAFFGSMEGLEDELQKLKRTRNYKLQELIFKEKKKKYYCYRVNYVDEKDTDINDIEEELRTTLEESVGNSLRLLWCDVYKVRRFPFEKGKTKKINIPEEKLLNMLNKKKTGGDSTSSHR